MATIKLPTPFEPLVEADGKIAEVWYRYFSESAISANSLSSALSAITTASTLTFATQADEEASTSGTAIVAPGVQQYHPSAAKAWGKVTVAGTVGTLNASYNVSGVTFSSLGTLAVSLSVPFSSSHYSVVASPFDGAADIISVSTAIAATSFRLISGSTDTGGFMFTCYGDQ